MSWSARTRALAGTIVAAGALTAGVLVSPSTVFGVADSLAANPALFGLAVAGLYLVRPLFAWPTTPLAAVVGYGFGVAVGVPIALVGVVATVVPVFLAARRFAPEPATDPVRNAPADGYLERTSRAVVRYYDSAGPLRGVTASRLAPIPSDVATCAAAVSGVELRHLVVGTAIGELPWTVAAVVVGASAATVTSSGLGDLGVALSIACALAAGLLLAGPVYRTVRSRADGSGRST
jgi:uncharacterized membrane protein YdjX (TVP38/TMEM64 family)